MNNKPNDEFVDNLLANLNTEQAKAATAYEGPMMVLAGPGTGKTQLIAARVAQILRNSDVEPRSILCLSFTDAAAFALRTRLMDMIGNVAHQVSIFTFHSFCQRIINENLKHFNYIEYQTITEVDRSEIVEAILKKLDIDNPFFPKNDMAMMAHFKALTNAFSKLKRLDASKNDLLKAAQLELEREQNADENKYKKKTNGYNVGDLKPTQVKAFNARYHRFVACVTIFELYKKAMEAKQFIDFDDMLIKVTEAFETNEDLLLGYQEQYMYLLVDEYQDSNLQQNKLVNQLISYWDTQPNILIVGDEDQSIYEFQGARVESMLQFELLYPSMERVVLSRNYRSSAPLLQAASALIKNNKLRLDPNKQLIPSGHYKDSPQMPKLWQLNEAPDEALAVVLEIERLNKEDGIAFDKMAVLTRKKRNYAIVQQLLSIRNIPYHTQSQQNLSTFVVIQHVLLLLEYLTAQKNTPFKSENLLVQLLYLPCWGIPPSILAKWKMLAMEAFEKGQCQSWHQALANQKVQEALTPQELAYFADFIIATNRFQEQIELQTAEQFLMYLYQEAGFLVQAKQSPNAYIQLKALDTLLNFIRELAQRGRITHPDQIVSEFQKQEHTEKPLRINLTQANNKGVKLSTLHSAKGLEFEVVFMLNCSKENWEDQNTGYNIRFPQTLIKSDQDTDEQEGLRRLFYVGITRAERLLYLTFYTSNGKKQQVQAPFLSEINEFIETENKQIDDLHIEWMQQAILVEPPQHQLPSQETMKEWVQKLVLSPSSFIAYLNCPVGFYYEHVLQIKTPQPLDARKGSMLHATLQKANEHYIANLRKHPSLDDLKQFWNEQLQRNQYAFSAEQQANLKHYGHQLLTAYKQQIVPQMNGRYLVERQYKHVQIEGVPLSGKPDLIEFLTKDQEIITYDYKSGSVKPTDLKKGKVWQQMAFYKVLLENLGYLNKEAKIIELSLDQDGVLPVHQIPFSAEDSNAFKEDLKTVWKNIQSLQFFNGKCANNCAWCQFHYNNFTSQSFENTDSELLDDDT
jgi:DNA helicase-2/ATP-dependent DNA helicase PcrA